MLGTNVAPEAAPGPRPANFYFLFRIALNVLLPHPWRHDCPLLQMTDFLEGHYLQEQVRSIKEIGDFITNLKRVGPGLGEFMFDKESLGD